MLVRVHHPQAERGALALRTDADWELDLAPARRDGVCCEFELGDEVPFRYLKPVLVDGGDGPRWAQGDNALALRGRALDLFPHFDPDDTCHVCTRHVVPASMEERGYDVRVFLPQGYEENPLGRYPVVYLQDGPNLFFPEEAFGGVPWRVAETLALLERMNALRPVVAVGVSPHDRMREYTAPGYEAYAAFLAGELKPWVDAHYRTRPAAADTAVMGSSLGGVVSLHAALARPDAFGQAACLSSTFGWRDDLFERVAAGALPVLRVYLDSGWPGDNYEVTRAMTEALRAAGLGASDDLLHVAWPHARHDERSWAERLHVPFQFLFGR